MSKIVAIIPARMASSRFPGKPLAMILGLPMIEHVRRRVSLCKDIDDVYVATCDEDIRKTVESNGGKVIMTSDRHLRCTDRIEEAACKIDADIIVNIQGDEPTVVPQAVLDVARPLQANNTYQCACLIYSILNPDELDDVNIVKAVISRSGSILLLSRAPIPYARDTMHAQFYKQSGIMAFKKGFLHAYSNLQPTPLEIAESIDMLRILEHDYKILGIQTAQVSIGVDIPADIGKIEKILSNDSVQNALYKRIMKS